MCSGVCPLALTHTCTLVRSLTQTHTRTGKLARQWLIRERLRTLVRETCLCKESYGYGRSLVLIHLPLRRALSLSPCGANALLSNRRCPLLYCTGSRGSHQGVTMFIVPIFTCERNSCDLAFYTNYAAANVYERIVHRRK